MINELKNKASRRKKLFLNVKLPEFCCRSGFLSSLYYAFFNSSFRRENKAVLVGKVKHRKEAVDLKSNYFLLVRNIHRLEKGLLMRPRRQVFATAFIAETVDSYIGLLNKRGPSDHLQVKWFTDVLSEYFSVCKPHPAVDLQRVRFSQNRPQTQGSSRSIPYSRDGASFSDVSYDQFYKLNRQRRSVRWFLDKPVSRELIDQAIVAAIQAPSACNRQPFEYRIIDDKELLKEVVDLPMGTAGYAQSIPVFVVVVGNLDAYFDERDRHLIYVDASLANMSFMLALETLGLASCPINWPDIESREQRMASFLNLREYQRPIMCIALGYPDPEGMVGFSEKRSLESVRQYMS